MIIDIKGSVGLKRDMANQAVINTDELAYRQYMDAHNKRINEKSKLESRINKIEEDVDFIKSALQELLSRVK